MTDHSSKTPPMLIPIFIAFALGWLFTTMVGGPAGESRHTNEVEHALGLELDVKKLTLTTETDSLAEAVGIKNGDVINSHSNSGEFSDDVYEHGGKPFAFEIMRDGSPVVILIPYLPEF